jgi:hypothetical protein
MQIRTASAVVWISFLLSGCAAATWSKPGASESSFYRDSFACEQQVANMYPSTPQPQADNYMRSSGYNTNCMGAGNQINCRTQASGNYYDVAAAVQVQTQTQNQQVQRNNALQSCMRAKGWRQGQ